jgi:hypothetical protein
VLEVNSPGAEKDTGELCPGVGAAHINNANGLDLRLRRLDSEKGRGLAVLDAAPELPLRGDNEMLIKRIGMGGDLHPLAAAGDDGQHG